MNKKVFLVGLIMFILFTISFLTNILGPIIPDIIRDFDLSIGMAGFLPFSFFVAYGVLSIPSGFLVERYGEKRAMIFAFVLAFAGALLFAIIPSFQIAIASLFIIGAGMTILQVAYNPLLRTVGGEENFAFYSVMGQLFFGLASFLSPWIYSYLVSNIDRTNTPFLKLISAITPDGLPWVSLYWIFAFTSLLLIFIIAKSPIPEVELKDDEKSEGLTIYKGLLRNKTVILFFIGIFCYVGVEQGIANWMSQFLVTYHDKDPLTSGAKAISLFWGLITVGSFVGLFLLKLFDSKIVLRIFATSTIFVLLFALYGSAEISIIAFPVLGFTISVMFSIIISLALNSLKSHHGAFSGILITGIVGGAILPLAIGWVGELSSLRWSMTFLLLPITYILSIGFWAKPLIKNKIILNSSK